MEAYLILEDGTTFTGRSIGSTKDVISEIVFNTSMTGYLEVLTDPSYAGQAVVMTYPLIGNYGICPRGQGGERVKYRRHLLYENWPDWAATSEMNKVFSSFLVEQDIPGIEGIDTRALTKRSCREKGTMNGMITTEKA